MDTPRFCRQQVGHTQLRIFCARSQQKWVPRVASAWRRLLGGRAKTTVGPPPLWLQASRHNLDLVLRNFANGVTSVAHWPCHRALQKAKRDQEHPERHHDVAERSMSFCWQDHQRPPSACLHIVLEVARNTDHRVAYRRFGRASHGGRSRSYIFALMKKRTPTRAVILRPRGVRMTQ